MKAVLLYDADCGFCTRSAQAARRCLRPDADVVAWQDADLSALGLTAQECDAALQWVSADGSHAAAQRAIAALLKHSGRPWRPLGRVLELRLIDRPAGVVYRWVAANRQRLPGGTAACAMPRRTT